MRIADCGLRNETSPQRRKARRELQDLGFAFLRVLRVSAVIIFENLQSQIRNRKGVFFNPQSEIRTPKSKGDFRGGTWSGRR